MTENSHFSINNIFYSTIKYIHNNTLGYKDLYKNSTHITFRTYARTDHYVGQLRA